MTKNALDKKKKKRKKPKTEAALILGKLAKQYYNNKCYVCHRKFGKGFALHHMWYYAEYEVRHSDYKDRNHYYRDLEALVHNYPTRFALLCKNHHFLVERMAAMKPLTWSRLIEIVERMRKAPLHNDSRKARRLEHCL